MRIFYGIILALTFSYCVAQDDDYADLALIASSKTCTVNGETGACVKRSQCNIATVGPRELSGSSTRASSGCGLNKICCPTVKVIVPKHEHRSAIELGCGYSNPGGSRIRNLSNKATYAAYADFPWMVALMQNDKYIGGGTIIHPSVVLTVAHKVIDAQANTLKCRAGDWNLYEAIEQNKPQERDVATIITHENFDRTNLYNDVALLILASSYDLADSPHMGVACLEPNLPPPGKVCYSMGWGKDVKTNIDSPKVLKKLEMPLVDSNVCEDLFRTATVDDSFELHSSLICAGGEEGVDTCIGDGGSSLVIRIPDPEKLRYSVLGMVVGGVGCGTQVPGLYAKVPEFYDWVVSKMTTNSLDVKSFKY